MYGEICIRKMLPMQSGCMENGLNIIGEIEFENAKQRNIVQNIQPVFVFHINSLT